MKRLKNRSEGLLLLLLLFVLIAVVCNVTIVYRACALALFIGCVSLGLREKVFINPYLLFSICPLTLAAYFSLTDIYMLELSSKTWLLCIINIYAFVFALFFTKPFSHKRNCISVTGNTSLVFHSIILFSLSYLSAVIPPLASIVWLFSIPAIVCAIMTKNKIMYGAVLVFIGSLFVTGIVSKMSMLLHILTILICYLKYFNWRGSRYRLYFLIVLGVVMMFLSFSVINIKGRGSISFGEQDQMVGSYQEYGQFEWKYSSSLFLPYMYLETPWGNVEYVVQTQDTRTNGLWMLKPLLGYIGVDEHYKNEYQLVPHSSFNTFTFVSVAFKDFGLWLSVLSTLFLGFFVKKIYTRYLISRSPFDVACWCAAALATAEMFFSNHFYMQSYPFTIFLLMEIYKLFVMTLGNSVVAIESDKVF